MELLNAVAYAIGNRAIRWTVRRTRYVLTRMVMTVISISIIAGVVQDGSISATFHDHISTMITGFQRIGADVFLQRIVDIMRSS